MEQSHSLLLNEDVLKVSDMKREKYYEDVFETYKYINNLNIDEFWKAREIFACK